jgi:uncharacterized protein (TIGR00299 family) protein
MGGLHLHLDPVGGIAGDMVCAALLDAFPDRLDGLRAAVAGLGPPEGLAVEIDPVTEPFAGRRFRVVLAPRPDHRHRHWREIRRLLDEAGLAAGVHARAVDIFSRLAAAEARVHGVAADDVEFHEVGDWDSIVDVVGAAYLLDAAGVAAASCGPLPLGGGNVRSAHGLLPVPAPATLELARGLRWHDDGIGGERVTPTGAAILAALRPAASPPPGTLRASGVGFGTRRLDGRPNCLRVLCLEPASAILPETETLLELAFDVDDQTAEDLAGALDRLRATAGVLDAATVAAIGKSGRLVHHVKLLCRPESLPLVAERCLRESSTIGLRWHAVERLALPRRFIEVDVEGRRMTVKVVDRPGGPTAKVESRCLARVEGADERQRLRRLAEEAALARWPDDLAERGG